MVTIMQNVMDDVRDFLSEGYSERKAIRTALNNNRHVLEEMWDTGIDMFQKAKMKKVRMTTVTVASLKKKLN